MEMHSRDDLLSRLDYDPVTGIFLWARDTGRFKKGDRAGTINWKGYVLICIDGHRYRAHRLAWLFVHGCWPTDQIDHRNGVKADNRIENLREATHAQNHQNRVMCKNNRSGFMGVYLDGRTWRAEIVADGKRIRLGRFKTPEDASAAYLAAKEKLHTFQPMPR